MLIFTCFGKYVLKKSELLFKSKALHNYLVVKEDWGKLDIAHVLMIKKQLLQMPRTLYEYIKTIFYLRQQIGRWGGSTCSQSIFNESI